MKKTTSSLIIVLVLMFMAPLIGYFGTKFILTSIWGSNSTEQTEQTETPAVEEQPAESDESETAAKEVFSIVLPDQTVYAVQIASLSSRDSAEAFAREAEGKGMTCTVMEKDGLYKVIHSGFFDGSDLSEILAHVKGVYSDAFITQKALAGKTLEMKFESSEAADAFQEAVDRYFEILNSVDDYATDKVLGLQTQGQSIASQLDSVIPSSVSSDETAADILQIMTETRDLYNTENSDYNAYNRDYLAILDQIFDTY